MTSKFDMVAEFTGSALGDPRRSVRLCALAEAMALGPEASFPDALDDAGLEGAYRFFANDRVKPSAVLEPHVRATEARMDTDVVLALHDTTTLSFRADGQRVGFEPTGGTQKLWSHVTLAVSGDGQRRAFGVLAATTANRIEHSRWVDHVTLVQALNCRKRIVHVMDREADDYALFSSMVSQEARFVVRLQSNRRLLPAGSDGARNLREALSQAKIVATREVGIARRLRGNRGDKSLKVHPVREGRLAELSIAAASVRVPRPKKLQDDKPGALDLHVVRAWEGSPPDGTPAVEWMLVTSEPITTVEEILQIVDWYRARWVIEEFFKALKTGCSIERRQLESFAGLARAVAFFCPFAWQLLLLRSEARREPQQPGLTCIDADELEVLRSIARKPLPAQPTVREIMLALATLGGHIKGNGEPGWMTLGRGYEKLLWAAVGWKAARATALETSALGSSP